MTVADHFFPVFLHDDQGNSWVLRFSLHFGFCQPLLHISVLFISSLLAFGIRANTSTKTKKTRGAANAVTPAKITRRAGNNKKAPVNQIQSDLNKDEAVSHKLDALMTCMVALSGKMQVLSGCVDAAKEREKDAKMPRVNNDPARTARKRASTQGF